MSGLLYLGAVHVDGDPASSCRAITGCLRRASRDSATFRWPMSVTRSAHE
jgi:hypothetical protein